MRRTKIVCTLGPATDNVEIMKDLIRNGMDAARVNFSHGTYESHGEMIAKLKQAREELGAPIPLILDTKGPEIRIKTFAEGKVQLEAGDMFTLTTEDVEGTKEKVSVTYADLPNDLSVGARVLIDDGLIELHVVAINGPEVQCRVINGGKVGSRKGVNLPGIKVNLPSMTEKDIEDLKFGVANGFDIVAASFIRTPEDVIRIRKVLEENGGVGIHIISKIENQEGVDRIDEILEVSDGIMVARGDMGVEIPPEEVPLVQKMLIKKANQHNKPAITATQMLESMTGSPRPTRAEANDVANAIFDGTDATMLSGETAAGAYPLEAVATMARIAQKAESSIDYNKNLTRQPEGARTNITNAISFAACSTAAELGTSCICTISQSGFTAKMIAKHRPICPVVAGTTSERVWRQLNLVWGCKPMLETVKPKQGKVFETVREVALRSGVAKNGDTIVLALGMPLGVTGSTNTLRVEIVGDVVAKGRGIGEGLVSGTARVIRTREDLEKNFQTGDILVATATDNDFMPYIQRASAIVIGPMDHAGTSHAEIAALALSKPLVICNSKVVDYIPGNELISVDVKKGYVYVGVPNQEDI